MARIRTIKPEFWHDEKVGELTRSARLFFIGMWNFADDLGRIGGVRRVLRGLLFPFDDDAEVDGWISELVKLGMVLEYRVKGQPFMQVVNWDRHQKIDKRAKSWIPGPESADSPEDPADPAEQSADSPEDPASDLSLNLGPQPQREASSAAPTPADLQALWNETADPALPRWAELTRARAGRAKSRLREHPDLAYWRSAIEAVNASPFCLGEKGWRASPDWLLQPDSATKALEGKYDSTGRGGAYANGFDPNQGIIRSTG